MVRIWTKSGEYKESNKPFALRDGWSADSDWVIGLRRRASKVSARDRLTIRWMINPIWAIIENFINKSRALAQSLTLLIPSVTCNDPEAGCIAKQGNGFAVAWWSKHHESLRLQLPRKWRNERPCNQPINITFIPCHVPRMFIDLGPEKGTFQIVS